jgi:hypothetical protein
VEIAPGIFALVIEEIDGRNLKSDLIISSDLQAQAPAL